MISHGVQKAENILLLEDPAKTRRWHIKVPTEQPAAGIRVSGSWERISGLRSFVGVSSLAAPVHSHRRIPDGFHALPNLSFLVKGVSERDPWGTIVPGKVEGPLLRQSLQFFRETPRQLIDFGLAQRMEHSSSFMPRTQSRPEVSG